MTKALLVDKCCSLYFTVYVFYIYEKQNGGKFLKNGTCHVRSVILVGIKPTLGSTMTMIGCYVYVCLSACRNSSSK